MSFLVTRPEALATAASQLSLIGSGMAAQNAAAATATTHLPPAAADEVSVLTARQFSTHAATYQTVGAQAMAVHELLTAILHASASSYAATETANAIAAC